MSDGRILFPITKQFKELKLATIRTWCDFCKALVKPFHFNQLSIKKIVFSKVYTPFKREKPLKDV
jgi:hypothetical protein